MKLTDEAVARALGWTEVRWRKNSHGSVSLKGLKPDGTKTPCTAPAFTTDLTTICAEVQALEPRGREWVCQHVANVCELQNTLTLFLDPGQWALGLLAYLKEQPKGVKP